MLSEGDSGGGSVHPGQGRDIDVGLTFRESKRINHPNEQPTFWINTLINRLRTCYYPPSDLLIKLPKMIKTSLHNF